MCKISDLDIKYLKQKHENNNKSVVQEKVGFEDKYETYLLIP